MIQIYLERRTTSMLLMFVAWLLSSMAGSALARSSDTPLEALIRQVRSEVKPDQAMQYMRHVYATDRWFTFPKFQETAEYLARTMKELGLEQVQVLDAPADGVSQFGYWTMPLAWDVKQARLEVVGRGVPAEFRVLADYERVPTSLGMWSGATPPGGVTADLVELKDTSPAAVERLDLKEKMVLIHENPTNIKWLLAKKGALGAINTFTENPALENGRQWINAWGDNGWAFIRNSSKLLCFSISPRQTAFLKRLMERRGAVRVKAMVDSRYYSGIYPYVTGVIAGTSPEEEVLTLGHTSEQGAHDNATGVAAMVESLATLNRLISAGKLPRPQRGIRILAMGELYGSMHYLATDPDRARHTVAALCLDTPAGFYHLAGTEYTFYLNPHVSKSYVDAFTLRVARAYFSELSPPRPWHWREYDSGTDNYLGDPTIGIATTWPYSGTGVHTHHNSEDTPETVDPRSLRDLTVLDAVYLYYLASAGESEALWLAEVALSRGYEQVAHSYSRILDRILTGGDHEPLDQLLRQGLDHIAYSVDREKQAVLSVLRLIPESGHEKTKLSLSPLLQSLESFSQTQAERLRVAVNRRASQLGIATPVEPAVAAANAQLAAASGIVVKRKRIGTLPLDDLPVDQREGYPAAGFSGTPVTALYWCDGHRTLAEVIRLTRLELGPSDFDFVGYFHFLERHGYVEFVKGSQEVR
ncbi:MAG: hypothetical protein DMG05_12710 [Acidobacteria bacterium]|nr:MAG: hypothetical protein DMG05_12710 [Acidobacteriota bacterium]